MNLFELCNDDVIEVIHNKIRVYHNRKHYQYHFSQINKIAIVTSDKGPFVDDVALAITFTNCTFIIPSEHQLYHSFLFENISKKIQLDFQKVIEASSCTQNAEFILYYA